MIITGLFNTFQFRREGERLSYWVFQFSGDGSNSIGQKCLTPPVYKEDQHITLIDHNTYSVPPLEQEFSGTCKEREEKSVSLVMSIHYHNIM